MSVAGRELWLTDMSKSRVTLHVLRHHEAGAKELLEKLERPRGGIAVFCLPFAPPFCPLVACFSHLVPLNMQLVKSREKKRGNHLCAEKLADWSVRFEHGETRCRRFEADSK